MRDFVLILRGVLMTAVMVITAPNVFAQVESGLLFKKEFKVVESFEEMVPQDSLNLPLLDLKDGLQLNLPSYSMMDYKFDLLNQNLSNQILKNLNQPVYSFPQSDISLFEWNKGAVIANGYTKSYPGLMQIDRGELGLEQSFGDFTLYVGGNATKYGYFMGLHTQYGINGALTYRINEQVSITALGNLYFGNNPKMANGMPMSPSLLGFYNVSRFGGYVDYRFSDKFGVEVGAQMVEQVGDRPRCYTLEPIVTPYWSPGGRKSKVKIGLPVGQIVYHILRRAIH